MVTSTVVLNRTILHRRPQPLIGPRVIDAKQISARGSSATIHRGGTSVDVELDAPKSSSGLGILFITTDVVIIA